MNAPFERKNSRQTLLFEGIAMLLVQDCPVSVVAERMGCNEKTIVRIMKHWVRKAWDKKSFAAIQNLSQVIKRFIKRISKDSIINSFDVDLWSASVESVSVGIDGKLTFRFKNGAEIKV